MLNTSYMTPVALFTVLGVVLLCCSGNQGRVQADLWTFVDKVVDPPRSLAATIFYNDSLYLLGGCEGSATPCETMGSAVTLYKAGEPLVELPPIPLGVVDGGLYYSVGFAGHHSVVSVSELKVQGFFDAELTSTIWVVGPCSMHFSTTMTAAEKTKFNTLWQLDPNLEKPMYIYDIQIEARTNSPNADPIPTRVNASCAAYGTSIYILGGVYMDRTQSGGYLELTSSIDIFDASRNLYRHKVFYHPYPVMNAAMALDNVLLYVGGGQTCLLPDSHSCLILIEDKETGETWEAGRGMDLIPDAKDLRETSSPAHDPGGTPKPPPTPPPAKFPVTTPSQQMYAYKWHGQLFYNATGGLVNVEFPSNPAVANTSGLVRILPFGGTVVMIESASEFSYLKLNDPKDAFFPATFLRWTHRSLTASESVGSRSGPASLTKNNIIGISERVDHFQGTRLNLYSLGGVNKTNGCEGQVFTCYLGDESLALPGPLNSLPLVVETQVPMSVDFIPTLKGTFYARLSLDPVCAGEAYFTAAEYPVVLGDSNVFRPSVASPKTYLCIGTPSFLLDFYNNTFYTVINPFSPISVMPYIPSVKPVTPSPPQKDSKTIDPKTSNQGTVIFGTVLGVLVLLGATGALVAFRRAKRIRLSMEDDLLDDIQDEETDSLVRNTTSDSKYKVMRRIGAGSFSTVFLVMRKTDGEQFALKFMACADDRERLDAIKECETINSLQDHPNVVQLYDMFMSYEFGRKESSLQGGLEGDMSRELLQAHRESGLNDPGGYGTLGGRSPLSPRGRQSSGLQGKGRRGRHERTGSDSSSSSKGSKSNSRSGSSNRSLPVHNRYLCLVMEYHAAGDLAHWVLNNHRDDGRSAGLSEVVLISVAYQLLSVLKHLHSQKPPVVHRDLKPENVLLRGSPSPDSTFLPVVVTDFGLAFIQEENRKGGKGGGTRPYIAPECWKGGVCTSSDLWSLGCVLYAVATQRVTADTVRVMFLDAKSPHFHEDIQYDLRVHRYSEKFARFVASLLVVDPKQRPTAAELLSRFSVTAGGTVENSSSVRFS